MSRAEIVFSIDGMRALRRMDLGDLCARSGVPRSDLTLLRGGAAKGVRFDTLARLCETLICDPGDLLSLERY